MTFRISIQWKYTFLKHQFHDYTSSPYYWLLLAMSKGGGWKWKHYLNYAHNAVLFLNWSQYRVTFSDHWVSCLGAKLGCSAHQDSGVLKSAISKFGLVGRALACSIFLFLLALLANFWWRDKKLGLKNHSSFSQKIFPNWKLCFLYNVLWKLGSIS